ncbi:hypothetical protein QFZ68_006124 [Streptomyces sp. V1I6]|nr:hypothetical protein [Streptomyces sp. V1I6]
MLPPPSNRAPLTSGITFSGAPGRLAGNVPVRVLVPSTSGTQAAASAVGLEVMRSNPAPQRRGRLPAVVIAEATARRRAS